MELHRIQDHWQDWAKQYGTDLRATTKTSTAKIMELEALDRALIKIEKEKGTHLKILEAGCGNGHNIFYLAERHPDASFTGIDYIEEMIVSANAIKKEKNLSNKQVVFDVGNVLQLSFPSDCYFDVIFTDRCLINLNTDALQQQAIKALTKLLKDEGDLLMIENSQQTYNDQNHLRELVGLPKRTPATFNHFFDEATLIPFVLSLGLDLVDIEDFISLHDIVLYVLVPMVNGGKIDYDHPLVHATTKLNAAMGHHYPNFLKTFGQNRLYAFHKFKEAE